MLSFSTTLLRILFIANLCLTGTYLNAMNNMEDELHHTQRTHGIVSLAQRGAHNCNLRLPEALAKRIAPFLDPVAQQTAKQKEIRTLAKNNPEEALYRYPQNLKLQRQVARNQRSELLAEERSKNKNKKARRELYPQSPLPPQNLENIFDLVPAEEEAEQEQVQQDPTPHRLDLFLNNIESD